MPDQASFLTQKAAEGQDWAVNNRTCSICGAAMVKNGKAKAGGQRWRCLCCGASSMRKADGKAKELPLFLKWLFSKDASAQTGSSRTTFWRKTSWAWSLWPVASHTGEMHGVVFLDGIWLHRKAVVLIATANGHPIAWHLARSEGGEAWAALMARIPAPAMRVCDGSAGFAKAASIVWPATRIRRCLFHVSGQVKRCTTLEPRLEAGTELPGVANELLKARGADGAASWLVAYSNWCACWKASLSEYAFKDGRKVWTHEGLRKARSILNKLVGDDASFAFAEMQEDLGGVWPSTNNAAESINARLRGMLRHHRGMPLLHRIKAIFRWCPMHTEHPLAAAEAIRVMPRDEDVQGLFKTASSKGKRSDGAPEVRGAGIVWEEFHMPTRYRE